MAGLIANNIKWKKGETGLQSFTLFDSDGITQHDGTSKTYTFTFWNEITGVTKGTGSLIATDATLGKYDFIVTSSHTNTVKEYLGEITETNGSYTYKTNTFRVSVVKSVP